MTALGAAGAGAGLAAAPALQVTAPSGPDGCVCVNECDDAGTWPRRWRPKENGVTARPGIITRLAMYMADGACGCRLSCGGGCPLIQRRSMARGRRHCAAAMDVIMRGKQLCTAGGDGGEVVGGVRGQPPPLPAAIISQTCISSCVRRYAMSDQDETQSSFRHQSATYLQ